MKVKKLKKQIDAISEFIANPATIELGMSEEDVIELYEKRYDKYTEKDKPRAYLKYLQDMQQHEDKYHEINIASVMIHKDLFDKLKIFNQDDWFRPKDELIPLLFTSCKYPFIALKFHHFTWALSCPTQALTIEYISP